MKQTVLLWLGIGLIGFCLMPWHMTDHGITSLVWLHDDVEYTALSMVLNGGKWWLAPGGLALLLALTLQLTVSAPVLRARLTLYTAVTGMILIAVQGLIIVRAGPRIFEALLSGEIINAGQPGMGMGAALCAISLLFVSTVSLSQSGKGQGDAFVVSAIGMIVALVAIFVFFPVLHILVRAFQIDGGYALTGFFSRFFSSNIWGLDCVISDQACGVGINSLFLALMTGVGTTVLGLAFALIFTRTNFRAKKLLRVLTVLPIITPPFVIGLALILLFGRAGTVTEFFANLLGWEQTRWLYGFWGIYFAQLLSFTPIAFLVLVGVVQGVSPSMEEASQTLDADRWQTFRYVSLPLMRPGLANAFLLSFIESLADFGNPLVLGSGYNVLSTDIYFAIVGSVADPANAAILALALLSLTLSAFMAQRLWLGKKSYATITGKADSGQNASLNPALRGFCYAIALPWAALTLVVYSMIVFGSFVKLWGYDNSFTLDHYIHTFGIDMHSGHLTGVAWDSYFTTLTISTIAAPLTAIVGLATAYLLVRQKFTGKDAFEFSTMLSFAIPGTVIGVSYIMAFNFPPIELTGTSIILIIVFVFRNMPVGVRGGIAAMSQLDKSLDEASITLGANSFTTVRRVILPLMGPALVAALTYSFVRAITSVSAVIFLVSAKHNMATSFIVGRVENGEFGIAIAYSVVLIFTMLAAIILMQLLFGTRRLRRTDRVQHAV
jgi:iron(III) transport system permease protein